jgi:hypothetical protein
MPCLFSSRGFDLLAGLRGPDPELAAMEILARAAAAKPVRYGEGGRGSHIAAMHVIGG